MYVYKCIYIYLYIIKLAALHVVATPSHSTSEDPRLPKKGNSCKIASTGKLMKPELAGDWYLLPAQKLFKIYLRDMGSFRKTYDRAG